jgi:hypothetical protein
MNLRMTAGAALVACAIAAAGCGGGGGGGSDGSLTTEEFVAQADAICQRAHAQLQALPDPTSLEQAARLARRGVEIGEAELEQLRGLRPGEEIAAQVDRAYGLLDQQLDLERRLADAAEAGDEAAANEIIAKGDLLEAEAGGLSRRIGLQVCGATSAA